MYLNIYGVEEISHIYVECFINPGPTSNEKMHNIKDNDFTREVLQE